MEVNLFNVAKSSMIFPIIGNRKKLLHISFVSKETLILIFDCIKTKTNQLICIIYIRMVLVTGLEFR